MAVRQILAMKRAALQSRIDALSIKDLALLQDITRLRDQIDGVGASSEPDQFQVAAMTRDGARRVGAHLQKQRQPLQQEIETLAREKLALDIADKKLAEDERRLKKLDDSRADLRR